jgi:hypothetical protein
MKNKLNTYFQQKFAMGSYGVLGVHGKLVKYVVHSSKRNNGKKNYFSLHKLLKHQLTSFWSQGILGVKYSKNSTKVVKHKSFIFNLI